MMADVPAVPPTAARAASTFRPALALMGGRAVGFAASFLIPVALARVLDQADFGTYKQLFLVAATLCGVAQLGMAESLFYFLPRAAAQPGRYVANSVAVLAVGGVACAAALAAGADQLARWLGNADLARHGAALGLYLALMVASAALEIVMIARKRYPLAASTYAALDVLRAGLLVGPALLVPGVSGLLAGAVAFAAVRCAAAAWYLGREFRGGALRPDAGLLRAQLGYALPFALAGLVEIVQSTFHQYWVAHQTDAASFAVYAVGCLQIPLVEVAATSVLNVMMVHMSEELGAGRARGAVAVWHDSTRKLALLFAPLVGFLVVAAHPVIVLLFTERYAASVPVFVVTSLGMALPVIAVDAVLRVHAQTRVLFGLNVVRLALTVALIGPCVWAFGLPGAVLATVLAAAAAKALGLAQIARLMRLSAVRLLPWRALALIAGAAALAAVLAALAAAALDGPPIAAIAVTGAVCGLVYGAGVWLTGALDARERAAIRRIAGRAVQALRGPLAVEPKPSAGLTARPEGVAPSAPRR